MSRGMTLRTVFETELALHGITWCTGGCRFRSSHRRGFATPGVVHLDAAIGTRRTLYRGFHEVAHVVLGHTARRRRPRWQLETDAEAWTQQRMLELRIDVPEASVVAGRAYIARMQRWGAAISAANTGERRRRGCRRSKSI
jgi:hypothetical protein